LGRFLNTNPWRYIQGRYDLYDFCVENPINLVEPYSAVELPIEAPVEGGGGTFPRIGPYPPPEGPTPTPGPGGGGSPVGSPTPVPPWSGPIGGQPILPDPPGSPPIYNPIDNPNRDNKNPCSGYVQRYHEIQGEIGQFKRDHPLPASWDCLTYMEFYDLVTDYRDQRSLGDQCHDYYGLGDGDHGPAMQQAEQYLQNTYRKANQRCKDQPPCPNDPRLQPPKGPEA
jgi:hypothetical protein